MIASQRSSQRGDGKVVWKTGIWAEGGCNGQVQAIHNHSEEGKTVKVTSSIKILNEAWIEAELGENDDKAMYLGAIGKIVEIEEDDDTVKVRYANYDTMWMPIKACVSSNGQAETLPRGMISHLDK